MKKAVLCLSLVLISGVGISAAYSEQECMHYATIEDGQYGAINPNVYDEMQSAQKGDNKTKINELLKQNKIIKIVSSKKLCVIEEPYYNDRSRINIPGNEIEYWVSREKLSKIK